MHTSSYPIFGILAISILVLACNPQFEYDLKEKKDTGRASSIATSRYPSWADLLGEYILPLLDDHDTQYTPAYSEELFNSFIHGTQERFVEQAIGKPFSVKRFDEGETFWYYSRPGSEYDSYYVRILIFDDGGSLIGRHRCFYID